jgi:alkylation response protein AidB-like acyl-CoA dehydrogenase
MESTSGHDRSIVSGLAAQGVCGILCPEAAGGSGLGLLDAAITAYELGRAAVPFSFHSAGVAAPLAVSLSGDTGAKRRWLESTATGEELLSFVAGAPAASGGKLRGRVLFAPDARVADAFVVVSGEGAARELLLLPRGTPGLKTSELATVDETRRVGELEFDDVEIGTAQRLAGVDTEKIDRILDAARIALAADAFGASERVLEEAVRYARTRKQFGRTIASYQAVKHMCAEAYAEIEPVRAFLWYAAFAWDERYEDASRAAALLKAHATEAGTAAVTTAVQVFGGMGFTWECDAHLWFKRVGYDRQMFGGPVELRTAGASLGD